MALTSISKQTLSLFGWLGISFTSALIGAIASARAGLFYHQLTRPDWAPPAWLFGPVWSILYLLMGIAAWLVSRFGLTLDESRSAFSRHQRLLSTYSSTTGVFSQMLQIVGTIVFVIFWLVIFGGMAIWPKQFYSVSRAKGELTNGPLLLRIIGIVMILIPIIGWIIVNAVE